MRFLIMRLFVSVPVPEEIRIRAAALSDELPADSINLIRPENMHLTMRFIGETADAAKITERLSMIRFSPFRCEIKRAGVFPSEDYVRVVWVGAESAGKLESLAKDVSGALAGFGKEEGEGFSAHLTIARVKRKIDVRPFLSKHRDESFGAFTVAGFELVESVLGGAGGPVYKTVAGFRAND